MIVIAGSISIEPEKRDAAIAVARDLMRETRKEPGCISYTFSADLENPGDLRLFEEWESQEALAAHFKTPHMTRFQAQVGGLGVREMKVQRYEIASVGPLRG